MNSVERQIEIALSRAPERVEVPVEMIRAKKTSGAAFTLACDTCGLDDKEIYGHALLRIDAGYFSNIKKSKATLQADLIAKFCIVVGNTIYPEWVAWQIGGTIVQLKSGLELENERLKSELAEERRKNDTITEFMRGIRA